MSKAFVFALHLLALFRIAASGCKKCYRRSLVRDEFVSGPRMHEILSLAALPAELDWRWKDGVNFTTVSRNQHIPKYCGACWSFAATSCLADRIRIARGPVGREINLAMQVILNCDKVDMGCSGGDALSAYQFIKNLSGLPEETCQLYAAEGHDTGKSCTAMDICKTCDSSGCRPQMEYPVYNVAEFGNVYGEHEMMAELQRGPIACAIATPEDFSAYLGYGIYEDMSGMNSVTDIDHLISVVGYGSEDGVPYWVIRNSWGTYWGYYGFARVRRGINNIAIETECGWGTPANGGHPTMMKANVSAAPMAEPLLAVEATASCRVERSDWTAVGGERVSSPRPHDVLTNAAPSTWDWRNVSGKSYVSRDTNENIPKYCASCWAHAVASALSDRIAIARNGAWPEISLSPQVLLNCRGGGSCSGGDPAGAYAYIHRHGVTDETCQVYQATELECNIEGKCMNCAPGNSEHGLTWPGKCEAVADPIMYFIAEYGSVRGPHNMKAEIFMRGPIGCGMEATAGFRNYTRGVYSEELQSTTINHQVSLAGWSVAGHNEAVQNGVEHWIGRNSWGTYWGEGGWFRIQMHRNNLGIEEDCDWGVPEPSAPVPSSMIEAPAQLLYM